MRKVLASPIWLVILICDVLFFLSFSASPELSSWRRIVGGWAVWGLVIAFLCLPVMFYRLRRERWRKSGLRGLLVSDMVLAAGGIVVLLTFMLEWTTTIRVETGGPFGPYSSCHGVEVWRSGFDARGEFRLTRIDERHGFYRVAGIQQSHSFAIYLVPPWVLLVLSVPFALWLLFSAVRYRRFLARLETGCCPRCGYDLADNPTGVCPECGTVVNPDPFVANVPGIQVRESVDVDDGKPQYSLILAAPITPDSPIPVQMQRLGQVLPQWLDRRGAKARSATLNLNAVPDDEREIIALALRLKERLPHPGLPIRVNLRNPSGRVFRQFGV